MKLAFIIGAVVLLSLGAVTLLNSHFIGQDVQITAENSNLSTNTRGAGIVEDKLSTIRSNTFQLLDLTNVFGSSEAAIRRQAEAFFFERNPDIASVRIMDASCAKASDLVNARFFTSNEIETDTLDALFSASGDSVGRSCSGETIALNASPFLSVPSMTLLFPWREYGREQTCAITFSIEAISDILGTDSINSTFLVNDTSDLLFHPDISRMMRGESLKNHPLLVEMRAQNQNNDDSRQIRFDMAGEDDGTTEGGEAAARTKKYLGAYQKLNLADIVICTTVPLDTVLEAVRATRTNNVYLTGVVFFLSITLILIFSRFAISRHLSALTRAAGEIRQGNFDTKIFERLNTKRKDEIGVLNQATKDELSFLTLFSKFTNQAVAKSIAKGDIDFDPHLKDITIFFSDIRGFTGISDGFKRKFKGDSPREIIEFLNDYMSRMVSCIMASGGNVDKFEGDAIMAVWGLLRDDSLDFERLPESSEERKKAEAAHRIHREDDAAAAVRGAIAMRCALMQYNKDAEAFTRKSEAQGSDDYRPRIRIGCGLNCGRATCGIMGSSDKMEYTAIGDAVNFASRAESSTKPCATDILITEDMARLIAPRFIRCKGNGFTLASEDEKNEITVEKIPVEFEVKGKGAQHFYGVVNMPRFDAAEFFGAAKGGMKIDADCARAAGPGGPKSLDEVRALLGIPLPDFTKVNLNEQENKVKAKR